MLKKILSIAGKPGLFELVSQGNNMLIVEDLGSKQRCPAYSNDKVISLADIAIFTEEQEVPLSQVFASIQKKENGGQVNIDVKDVKKLRAYFGEVLPNYDKERVYNNDIKKVIRWYNLLTTAGKADFEEPKEENKAAAE
jgi:hypothetical protein